MLAEVDLVFHGPRAIPGSERFGDGERPAKKQRNLVCRLARRQTCASLRDPSRRKISPGALGGNRITPSSLVRDRARVVRASRRVPRSLCQETCVTAPGLGARELPILTGLSKVLGARHVGQRVGSKRVAFIRILLYVCVDDVRPREN